MKGVKRLALMLVASVLSIITLWGGTGSPTTVQLVPPEKAERQWMQAVFAHWPAHAPVRVDVFGGSIAAGWVDNEGGYIDRALRGWAAASGIHVRLLVRAVPGMAIVDMRTKFNQIVTKTKPNWVILSWGGLNDAVAHTSVSTFTDAIRTEIADALRAGVQFVWVVTPPVTAAAVIDGPQAVPDLYFEAELSLAKSLQSPRVLACPVFGQMAAWLEAHGQTYVPYEANGWHPNAKGHALAGQLLLEDINTYVSPFAVRQDRHRK